MRFPSRSDHRRSWSKLTFALLIVVAACAGLSSCTTPPSKNKDLLRQILPPQLLLTESAIYNGGALKVEGWLGPTVRLKTAGQKSAPMEESPRNREKQPAFNPDACPFKPGPDSYTAAEVNEMYGRKNYEDVVPPRSALILRFTNSSAQAITFRISDVNSHLGDFVPRPETLTVAPGDQASVEPMLSNLNNNFDALDVTVTLRFGEKTETHVLKLH